MSAPPRRYPFPRSHRLTRRADLDAVMHRGKRLRTEHLDVRAVASLLRVDHPRVGFIVPKYRRSIVERNRLKRRLRDLARTRLLPALPPVDLVVRARAEAYLATFDALAGELERVLPFVARQAASL